MSEIQVHEYAWKLSILQAKSLAKKAEQIVNSNDNNSIPLEEALNFLIIAGLSVELYLKSFMIFGRAGKVTRGHDLEILYCEFPDFLKRSIRKHYDENNILRKKRIVETGIIFSKHQPHIPDKDHKCKGVYSDFDSAIKSIKTDFIRARYLFEKLSDDYIFVEYPSGSVLALIEALEYNFVEFRSDGFKRYMSS